MLVNFPELNNHELEGARKLWTFLQGDSGAKDVWEPGRKLPDMVVELQMVRAITKRLKGKKS